MTERFARASPAAVPLFWVCLLPFIVLAILNAGGYRYGASDQAFYVPAVLKTLDPELFPRDSALLAAQTTLTVADDAIAMLVSSTGLSLPVVFAALYVLALVLYAAGGWLVGSTLYRDRWMTVGLLAGLTLRHAIARSGTNTLEGYFHPRMLAYGLGVIAVGAFLRGRFLAVAGLTAVAAAIHPTTALWFCLWFATAAAIAAPGLRRVILPSGLVAALAGLWMLVAGPLAGRLTPMDSEWLQLLGSKDYLFPLQWPAYAWFFNLGYLVVIAAVYRVRRRRGLVGEDERALVLGSCILLAVFVAALVAHSLQIALSFQLQPARIFWMFDFLALIYAVWWIGNASNRPVVVAAAIAGFAMVRGAYVLTVADRPALQPGIRDDDWGRVMAWARSSDKHSAWLADPLHAVLYGTSVRVAGERDVYVEAVKDAAIGMYSRDVAVRTAERLDALGAFERLSVERARDVARTYDLDYLVAEAPLDLPVVFQSGRLRVYKLQ